MKVNRTTGELQFSHLEEQIAQCYYEDICPRMTAIKLDVPVTKVYNTVARLKKVRPLKRWYDQDK